MAGCTLCVEAADNSTQVTQGSGSNRHLPGQVRLNDGDIAASESGFLQRLTARVCRSVFHFCMPSHLDHRQGQQTTVETNEVVGQALDQTIWKNWGHQRRGEMYEVFYH